MALNFFTQGGLEVPSINTQPMIEVDRVALEETGPNLFQMMENAGRNLAMQAIACLGERWHQAQIVVLAGTGVNALGLIQWAKAADAPIFSLDIPSGVDSTTGAALGEFIQANWTMTLALPKTGLLPDNPGELMLADIGIPAGAYAWKSLGIDYTPPFGDRYQIPLSVRTVRNESARGALC